MSYPTYQHFSPPRWHEANPAPVEWEVRRLKFTATCNDETLPENTDPDYTIAYVDISSVDIVNGITAVEFLPFEEAPSRARRVVRDGDTIVSTVRTYLKAIAAIEEPPDNMIVSTGFAVVRPLDFIDSGFLGYALQGKGFIDAVVANSTGVSYPAINPTMLVCLPFAYPEDKKEQQQIAAFLDWKTGQIDALIAKKKELLEKLKEKRLATITQAVTRGLNPTAPLRDSGIPWLGQVPKHWGQRRLKFCVTVKGGGTPNTSTPEYWDGNIPWVSPKDMKFDFITEAEDNITELGLIESASVLIAPNTVLVVVRSGILRHTIPVALNKVPVAINQDMKALSPNECLILSEYLMAFIFGNQKALLPLWTKPGCTVESIEMGYMLNTVIPLPPIDEQKAIANFINDRRTQILNLEMAVETAIDRLTEYRAALITAATTGKIDVRGVKIPNTRQNGIATTAALV